MKTAALSVVIALMFSLSLSGQPASSPFGVIDDRYEVNAAGAYNHIIPLQVAPGINGLAPNLALVYDSRSGISELGHGWALSGLSRITRSNNTFAQQGVTGPISFTSRDAFLLDGQYLTCMEGDNGGSSSKYRTENETFSIIWSLGTIHNSDASPRYFVVKQANGLTYYYGSGGAEDFSSDARVQVTLPSGKSAVMAWHIKKIVDPYGNYILFEYKQNDINSIRIESIAYTGNQTAGLEPGSKITFRYADPEVGTIKRNNLTYISGVPFKNDNQLTAIGMMTEGRYFKYYHFTYDPSGDHLLAVTESSDEDKTHHLPPTTLSWHRKDTINFAQRAYRRVQAPLYTHEVDLNNDGLTEYLTVRRKPGTGNPFAGTGPTVTIEVFQKGNTPSGGLEYYKVYETKFEVTGEHPEIDGTQYLFADVNSDQLPDLVTEQAIYLNASSPKAFQFTQTLESHLRSEAWRRNEDFLTAALKKDQGGLYVADLDKNGLPELIALNRSKKEIKVFGQQNGFYYEDFRYAHNDLEKAVVQKADLTGGGREDFLLLVPGKLSAVRLSLEGGQYKTIAFELPAKLPPAQVTSLKFIDLNADGIEDLYLEAQGTKAKIWINSGQGFAHSEPFETPFNTTGPAAQPKSMRSFIGQFTSLKHVQLLTLSNSQTIELWNIVHGKKDQLSFVPVPGKLYFPLYLNESGTFDFTDLDNDGDLDILWKRDENGLTDYYVNTGNYQSKLRSVTDGLGNEVSVQYAPLADTTVYSCNGDSLKSNYAYYSGPYVVVKALHYSKGRKNSKNIRTYRYQNLVVETTGRGFSGFQYVTEVDETSRVSTKTRYEYHFPLTGKIIHQEKQAGNGVALYRLENNWSFQVYNDKGEVFLKDGFVQHKDRRAPSMAGATKAVRQEASSSRTLYHALKSVTNAALIERDFPGFLQNEQVPADAASVLKSVASFGRTKITYIPTLKSTETTKYELDGGLVTGATLSYTYDDLGYVTRTEQRLGNGQVLVNHRQHLHIHNNHTEKATYILGLVVLDSSFVYQNGEPEQQNTGARTVHYRYDRSTGALLEKIRQKGNPAFEHTTTQRYDPTGNLIERVYFPGTERETRESYIYSEDRRFVQTYTNAMGFATHYQHDVRTGALSWEGNHDKQLWTKNTYDAFGLLRRTEFADGRFIAYAYEFIKGGNDPLFKAGQEAVYSISVMEAGAPPVVSYYNAQGQEIAAVYSLLDSAQATQTSPQGSPYNRQVIKAQQYDRNGNVAGSYKPFYLYTPTGRGSGEACVDTYRQYAALNFATRHQYDALHREQAFTDIDGSEYRTEVTARKTTRYNSNNQRTTSYFNTGGEVIAVGDDQNNLLHYQYDPWGNITRIIDPDGSVVETEYDLIGRKTRLTDPSLGTVTYRYDAFDRVIEEQSGDRVVYLHYDPLNRVTRRTTAEGTIHWYYDRQVKGRVDSVVDARGNVTTFTYDRLARIREETQTLNGKKYTKRYTYDQLSRLETKTYPAGFKIRYHYTNNLPVKISAVGKDNRLKTIWEIRAVDAEGHVLEKRFGNGLHTSYRYDPFTSLVTSIRTRKAAPEPILPPPVCTQGEGVAQLFSGPPPYIAYRWLYEEDLPRADQFYGQITDQHRALSAAPANDKYLQHLSFEYDGNHNLKSKTDSVHRSVEGYLYDNLQRLTRVIAPGGGPELRLTYDALGNILYKSDVGVYEYDEVVAQRLKTISRNGQLAFDFRYDSYGNVVEEKNKGLKIQYTSFNKPLAISTNTHQALFTYGYEHQELEARYYSGSTLSSTLLSPFTDVQIRQQQDGETILNYIAVGSELVAVHYQQPQTSFTQYIHKDQLGSVHFISDEAGRKVVEYRYTAFGQRSLISGSAALMGKGYTGHEHLEDFELINAAARLYAPAIGRFLAPDPFVASPSDLQSFNRYSYVLNNPLNTVDPSGFWGIKIKAPRIKWNPVKDVSRGINNIGRAVGKAHEDIYNEGDRFIDKNGKQIVVFAAAVAITYFSGGICSGLAGAMLQGAVFGATMQGGMTAAHGGTFQDVMNSAFKGAYTGAASAVVFYGIGSAFSSAHINTEFGSSGYWAKTAAHGAAGGAQSELQGGTFKDGFLGASVAHAFAPASETIFTQQDQVFQRVAFSAAAGGMAAYVSGGDVAMGMTKGAFSRWFNDEYHSEDKYRHLLKNVPSNGPAISQGTSGGSRLSKYELEHYERIQFERGINQGYRDAYKAGKIIWENRPAPENIMRKVWDYSTRIDEVH